MLDPVVKKAIKNAIESERVIRNSMGLMAGLVLVNTSGLICDAEMKRQACEMLEKVINNPLIKIENDKTN
jgi:hypothetical protein